MTRQSGIPDAAPSKASSIDVFVIVAVTILSLASGAWMLASIGVAIWWAMIGALAVYATLLTLHLMARRTIAALDRARPAAALEDTDWLDRAPDRIDDTLPRPRDFIGEPHPGPVPELAEPRAPDPFSFRPMRTSGLELPIGHAAPSADELRADPRYALGGDSIGAQMGAQAKEPPRLDPGAGPEVSVEDIRELIKKLADELNDPIAAEQAADPLPAAEIAQAMIGQSVAALETTARGMRAPAGQAAASQTRQTAANVPDWWPVAGDAQGHPKAAGTVAAIKPPSLNPQIARIAEAVAAERIEVLMEPIHALAEGRVRHFEISVRLLTADGDTLEQSEFSRAAHGSGLMPRIDGERMIRAARVARRLGERGRQGAVLSAIAGESLTDAEFLGTAASSRGAEGRMHLVLAFAQSEVRTFTVGHAEALARLAKAGYGFALEDVTDLDMDFEGLAEMGFEFVKLDAPVFLEGLDAPDGHVPAADICRHLAEFGLVPIVGRIDDDRLAARLRDLGVQFGKGGLYGGPKLVKAEVVAAAA